MSPRRKVLLLKTFDTISRLRKASPSEISSLPGFSETFAQTLLDFLKKS
jgi:excinuclease UvrABC nuclease subunit